MLQFYFMSILLNVLAGLVLVYATDFTKKAELDSALDSEAPVFDEGDADGLTETDGEKKAAATHLFKGAFFDDMTFRLVLGLLSVLSGLMKLLSPVKHDMPVVGDLIPSLAGLAAGLALLIEYYSVRNSLGTSFPQFVDKVFFEGRKYIGVFCIIAGLMHFIFPGVLFL